jgi:hypothetical protein
MKELWAAHKVFVCVTGGALLASLVLLLGVALPARSAAGDLMVEAEGLAKTIKSREGEALSSSARASLEAEVEGLRARVAELERVMNPPKGDPGADPVLAYGTKLSALRNDLTEAAAQSISVPERPGFPEEAADDVPVLLPVIELAQRMVQKAVAAGVRRIDAVSGGKSAEEFLPGDLADQGAVRRTVTVIEITGPIESLMKFVHGLQQRESLYIIPRAKLWRMKPESPDATLRIAVGSVTVSDKVSSDSSDDGSSFLFGR